jgi:peptidoglycan hydrolase-like protein with peptidoglycan-binding domain
VSELSVNYPIGFGFSFTLVSLLNSAKPGQLLFLGRFMAEGQNKAAILILITDHHRNGIAVARYLGIIGGIIIKKERKSDMKKTHSTVLSSLVLSGAVLVMAPQAWSQTGGSSGGSSPSGSEKSSEPSGSGSSRGTSGTGSSSSGSDVQTQRDRSGSMGSSRRASGSGHISKDKVKEVQAALKSKGMDPGPEDGVMGPKTQAALREFQKSNSLQATGRIDEKTASALGVDVASSSSSGMGSSSSGSSTGSRGSSKDSSGIGAGSGSSSSSGSGSTSSNAGADKETSKGVSKSGSQSGSAPSSGSSTSPATKPTGRE